MRYQPYLVLIAPILSEAPVLVGKWASTGSLLHQSLWVIRRLVFQPGTAIFGMVI